MTSQRLNTLSALRTRPCFYVEVNPGPIDNQPVPARGDSLPVLATETLSQYVIVQISVILLLTRFSLQVWRCIRPVPSVNLLAIAESHSVWGVDICLAAKSVRKLK